MATVATIQIVLRADGQVGMQAQLSGGKIQALGMLELARDLVLHPPPAAAQTPLLLARGSLPNGK